MSRIDDDKPFAISSVTVEGLFSRYDFHWDLDDVNVLVGKNGSGKSTILKIIEICLCSPEGGVDRREVSSILKKFKKAVVTLNNGCVFEMQPTHSNELLDELLQILDSLSGNPELQVKMRSDLKANLDVDEVKAAVSALRKHPMVLTGRAFIKSEKEGGGRSEVEGIKDIINVERISTFDMLLLSKKEYDEYAGQYYSELSLLLGKEIDKLKDLIIEKSNDVHDKISKNSSTKKYGAVRRGLFKEFEVFKKEVNEFFLSEGKRFEIKQNGDVAIFSADYEIGLEDLSSGEKQILIILLKAMNSASKPAIIICDEPELSLHLAWQERLISSIKKINPGAQLIVASHSPAVVMKGWIDSLKDIGELRREVGKDA